MNVDVVIVNWNSGSLIIDCINSLVSCGSQISKIILVDNASTDGSDKLIIEQFKNIKIIKNKENLGFGRACNIGASYSKSEYILFLNPDAVITKDALLSSLNFMSHPKNSIYGVLGIKLFNDNNQIAKSSCRLPTLSSMFFHSIGIDRLFPKTGYFMTDWDHEESSEVDHVIGAYYFIRRSIFFNLQGFDERFFVYLEDLDLSVRVRGLGYKIFYLADTEAFHVGGGTSNKVKALRLFYSIRSRLLYVTKHFSFVGYLLIFFSTIFIEPIIRIIICVLKFDLIGVSELLKCYYYIYRWFISCLLNSIK